MKRSLTYTVLTLAALSLTACGESYTYEADPIGGGGDNPREISCFMIEADSSNGDDGDVALGEFCATEGRNDLGMGDDDEADD